MEFLVDISGKMWLCYAMLFITPLLLMCLLLFCLWIRKRPLTGWTGILCDPPCPLWVLALLLSHGSTCFTSVSKVLLMLMVTCPPSFIYRVAFVKVALFLLCFMSWCLKFSLLISVVIPVFLVLPYLVHRHYRLSLSMLMTPPLLCRLTIPLKLPSRPMTCMRRPLAPS